MKAKFFGGDENTATSVLLPSKPVCRLVGHDDNAPITLVRFTCKSVDANITTNIIYLDDEKTFSRLDRTVITVLTTSLKILILYSFTLN
jgi:hypothetical protein